MVFDSFFGNHSDVADLLCSSKDGETFGAAT